MSARDFADLSRERVDDDLHGDEYRRRAMERADRLREVSDLPEMALPFVHVERVRPARRPEPRFTGAELGFLVCAALLTLGWLAFLAICAWLVLG